MGGDWPLSIPLTGNYSVAGWVFLRLLGVVYFCAFASWATQIVGLVGRNGIVPIADILEAQKPRLGGRPFLAVPTLCWWRSDDRGLRAHCWVGAVLSLCLVAGVAPIPVLVALWLLYLSLSTACTIFAGFQWDALLVEMGFLAIFFAPADLWTGEPWAAAVMASAEAPLPEPPVVARLLMYWLLFRLMFTSGVVKLQNSNPAWRNLTAMRHHYYTQPLPSRWAWHAQQTPEWFHKGETLATLVIETLLPLLIFFPSPLAEIGAAGVILLMVLIHLTGNYCFFNLQAVALSLLLIDDGSWAKLASGMGIGMPAGVETMRRFAPLEWPVWWWVSVVAAVVLVPLTLVLLGRQLLGWNPAPAWLRRAYAALQPFRLVNPYGLFANMTMSRPEIIVEGSDDGANWVPYRFKHKPGRLDAPPRRAAPHQPRLDWQMWFAALTNYRMMPWFDRFLQKLLAGSPEVLALLDHNPFPNEPPRYLRAVLYEYGFTSWRERRRTGQWWSCRQVGLYCPALSQHGPLYGLGFV